jgi:Ran-binding protein 1
LYRFVPGVGETPASWITRGKGDIKIVQNKESKRIHLAMHMEKTFRTCLNAQVLASTEMTPNSGSDRAWNFVVTDYADFDNPGVAQKGVFLVKFKTDIIAKEFKDCFDKFKVFNAIPEEFKAAAAAAAAAPAAETETTTTTTTTAEAAAPTEAAAPAAEEGNETATTTA